MQPDVIVEARCAQGELAATVRRVTGGTGDRELLLADQLVGAARRFARMQLADIGHQSAHLLGRQRRKEGGHLSAPPLADRGVHLFGRTAVQPVLVAEVGETDRAVRVVAVAAGAIAAEQLGAHAAGSGLILELFDAETVVLGVDRVTPCLDFGEALVVLLMRSPAQASGEVAEARIEQQIAQPEDDRQHE